MAIEFATVSSDEPSSTASIPSMMFSSSSMATQSFKAVMPCSLLLSSERQLTTSGTEQKLTGNSISRTSLSTETESSYPAEQELKSKFPNDQQDSPSSCSNSSTESLPQEIHMDSCEDETVASSPMSISPETGSIIPSCKLMCRDPVDCTLVDVANPSKMAEESKARNSVFDEIDSKNFCHDKCHDCDEIGAFDAHDRSSMSSYSSSFAEHQSPSTGAGLENLGNTCFINAVLQCFTHTVPLVQKLWSFKHGSPCFSNHGGFCTLCALRDHVKDSLASPGGTVRPEMFVRNLNHISASLQMYQQEDAHEFLQCMLDKLEFCAIGQKTQEQHRPTTSSEGINFVKEIFGGRLRSQVKCCSCGHCSDTLEPLIDLSLEIEDANSLLEALQLFTQVEKVGDSEPVFFCEDCNMKVVVEKQFTLESAPLITTFHFKRFKTDDGSVQKISKFVRFPLEVDLKSFLSGPDHNDRKMKYILYAVIVHEGHCSGFGHYISYIRSSENCWHQLDDEKVTMVSKDFVLAQKAYILFYAREDVPWCIKLVEAQPKKCSVLAHISGSSTKSMPDNPERTQFSPTHVESKLCVVRASKLSEENATASSSIIRTDMDSLINQDSNELDVDIFVSSPPLTPPRSLSPDISSIIPSGLSQSHALRGHENNSGKMDVCKCLEGMQGRALSRHLRGMPSSRRRGFLSCIESSQKCHFDGALHEKKRRQVFPNGISAMSNMGNGPPRSYKFSA